MVCHELFAQAGLKPQSSQVVRITGVSHWPLWLKSLAEEYPLVVRLKRGKRRQAVHPTLVVYRAGFSAH
jgi:hypothetical protein